MLKERSNHVNLMDKKVMSAMISFLHDCKKTYNDFCDDDKKRYDKTQGRLLKVIALLTTI